VTITSFDALLTLDGPLTLRDKVLELLRNQIINCTLPPGMLIKEEELAARLGISKTPLREALTHLGAEGLVDMPSNRIKRVAPLTRARLVECHLIFQVLRETAYRIGLSKLGTQDIEQMQSMLDQQRKALNKKDWVSATRSGRQFHEVIVKATGNSELYRLAWQYTHGIDRVSIMLRSSSDRARAHADNVAILRAIRAGDFTAATKKMREQNAALADLLQMVPEEFDYSQPYQKIA